jgi:hypothetical protein
MRWRWLVLISLWLLALAARVRADNDVVKLLPPTTMTAERGEYQVVHLDKNHDNSPHYEVIEYCAGCETIEAETGGFFKIAEGQGNLGPNTFATFSIHAQAMGAMISRATIGPLTIHHRIEVKWNPGDENSPEPKEGLTLHFIHSVEACVETFGIGAERFVGTAKGKAQAYTNSPGGFLEVVSQSECSGIGTSADPVGRQATFTLVGLKSGWCGYLDATVSGSVSAALGGFANATTTAQITWKAEIKRGER